MPPPSERQKKRARDEARAARWAHENAPQAPTTTAPGGLELERLRTANSRLEIEVKDYDTIGRDDVIGATAIDLEDRVFHPAWQEMPLKPLEWRTLRSRRSKTPQGSLQLWVELLV